MAPQRPSTPGKPPLRPCRRDTSRPYRHRWPFFALTTLAPLLPSRFKPWRNASPLPHPNPGRLLRVAGRPCLRTRCSRPKPSGQFSKRFRTPVRISLSTKKGASKAPFLLPSDAPAQGVMCVSRCCRRWGGASRKKAHWPIKPRHHHAQRRVLGRRAGPADAQSLGVIHRVA